jgi:hypothetical protein
MDEKRQRSSDYKKGGFSTTLLYMRRCMPEEIEALYLLFYSRPIAHIKI